MIRPQLNSQKHAVRILLLPAGEGRDEGRLRSSSLIGSWSQCVSILWKTCLPMIRPQLNPQKHAVRILLLPPGEGRDEGRLRSSSLIGSWSQCVSKFWKTFLPKNETALTLPSPPVAFLLRSPVRRHVTWLARNATRRPHPNTPTVDPARP